MSGLFKFVLGVGAAAAAAGLAVALVKKAQERDLEEYDECDCDCDCCDAECECECDCENCDCWDGEECMCEDDCDCCDCDCDKEVNIDISEVANNIIDGVLGGVAVVADKAGDLAKKAGEFLSRKLEERKASELDFDFDDEDWDEVLFTDDELEAMASDDAEEIKETEETPDEGVNF